MVKLWPWGNSGLCEFLGLVDVWDWWILNEFAGDFLDEVWVNFLVVSLVNTLPW